MYLHLGQETVVRERDIIGIFDLDNTTVSRHTRKTLNEAEKAATRALQNKNLAAALAQPCDVLVLDEAGSAWELDMVDKALLQQAVLHRPAGQECVLTAHAAPGWMLDAADYLTEMCCRRHPYQKGIKARKGIEY